MHAPSEPATLIPPYRGRLVDLSAGAEEAAALGGQARRLPWLALTPRALLDLELLATGAFSPLDRFMGSADYLSVLEAMRLRDGTLWPIPITLPAPAAAEALVGRDVALRDERGEIVALMRVDEVFGWDLAREAECVLGRSDPSHPLVAEMSGWHARYASGPLRVLRPSAACDFVALRRTPLQVRAALRAMKPNAVVAFQTRNPMHRSHEEMTRRAVRELDAVLLIHPVVGLTRPGDTDHYTRVRTYQALLVHRYDASRTLLSLLPLAMRMAGPREALWHALIRRNYGASHLIVGRDHAGPGPDAHGRPFFEPYAAQDLARRHAGETGVAIVPFRELAYLPEQDRYEEAERVEPGTRTLALSGSEVREHLSAGRELPAWFARPEVARILSDAQRAGVCVWFTGLSGAGKSSTAEALAQLLLERGLRVTLLDGDAVRSHLSKGLGFSREDRDANVERIGFVAAAIVHHGGIAICAAVSPYRAARSRCRERVGAARFVEVHVATPIAVCEQRDAKGLYARARAGELTGFTGVDDPYEAPEAPEIALSTERQPVAACATLVLQWLIDHGLLPA